MCLLYSYQEIMLLLSVELLDMEWFEVIFEY